MLNREQMERVVSLQAKSHNLLRWVNEALRAGTLSLTVIHDATTLTDAAMEWIRRNYASLPLAVRPAEGDIEPFAHLFVSYLTTSYELRSVPGTVAVTGRRGCYCGFCAYLVSANYLTVRKPDKKALARAQEMKDLCLVGLAQEEGISLSATKRQVLLSDTSLARTIAYATYGRELLRRSQFASQGEGVLVLWREIAWKDGRLDKRFVLSAEQIMVAERQLCARFATDSS